MSKTSLVERYKKKMSGRDKILLSLYMWLICPIVSVCSAITIYKMAIGIYGFSIEIMVSRFAYLLFGFIVVGTAIFLLDITFWSALAVPSIKIVTIVVYICQQVFIHSVPLGWLTLDIIEVVVCALVVSWLYTKKEVFIDKNEKSNGLLWLALILAVILVICIAFGDETIAKDPDETIAKDPYADYHAMDKPVQNDNASAETNNSMTVGQENALSRAISYLDIMAFSKDGLISQLEFDEYSHEDAIFAVDNCGADWNEQAVLKAKDYLETMPFSYSGLIEQLKYEGFTVSEAMHGANECEADWNEQAVLKAKSYLEIFDYSREELIEQLQYEGFTLNQASYGASENGY